MGGVFRPRFVTAHTGSLQALDVVSCLRGYVCKTSDVVGAYCQTYLHNEGCVETWVALPEHRWPKEWIGKYRTNQVVRLTCSLREPGIGRPVGA